VEVTLESAFSQNARPINLLLLLPNVNDYSRLRFPYAALFIFAHRARCAAAIFLRAASDIVLFGFGAWPFAFAHRVFCARLILRRPAAEIVRDAPLELTLPNAASAESIRWSCFCVCFRSFFNCWTTTDMCFIGTPGWMIAEARP
jgi:hypothetical protein